MSEGFEIKRLRSSFQKLQSKFPGLISKYKRSLKNTVSNLFLGNLYNHTSGIKPFLHLILSIEISLFQHLLQVMTGVMLEEDNAYSIQNTWLCNLLASYFLCHFHWCFVFCGCLSLTDQFLVNSEKFCFAL